MGVFMFTSNMCANAPWSSFSYFIALTIVAHIVGTLVIWRDDDK
jgi:hypothetical protein